MKIGAPRPTASAARLLARHFFRALFDFGVFTQEGADAFVRVLIGLASLILSLGLLLVYMYGRKYALLSRAPMGEPYVQAFLADLAMAIAVPMWIVALVTVLISHSLFPDETDFRVLLPLPIGGRLVFASKLVALALFAGLFTFTSELAMTPVVLRISSGQWAMDALPFAVLAYWVSAAAASALAVLGIVALNGAVTTCIPRSRVHAVSGAMRGAMLGALVLALPFVLRLPAEEAAISDRSPLMLLAPPVWFMGVQRVLLGHRDAYYLLLARRAAVALAAVSTIAILSYAIVYRRFDRVMLHAFGVSRGWLARRSPDGRPARAAVRDFTLATLRRSALHQGIAVGLSACGVAIAIDMLLRNGLVRGAVAWIPFPMIVLFGIAARASFALPIEPRANWVFRVTERGAIRADELHAVERAMALFAIVIPVALTLPIQWMVAGPRAIAAAAITAAFGFMWMETLLRHWRRIPFTCSYMPGKRSVAQWSLVAVVGFLSVSSIGSAMETAALRGPLPPIVVAIATLLVASGGAFRRSRRRLWRDVPLMFDDELASDVQRFQLSSP